MGVGCEVCGGRVGKGVGGVWGEGRVWAVAERVLPHFPHAEGPQLRGAAKNEKNCFFPHIFPSICLKKR